jgi:hypothetical protein
MKNVHLSQERTANVLDYILFRGTETYDNLPSNNQDLVRYWFTANGFSFGRTLDEKGEFTIISNEEEDKELSRRVEFRIVTKTEELIKRIIEQKQI